MTIEINVIVEGGLVTEVFGTADQDIVVNVIDLDSQDPNYADEAYATAEEIRGDPAFENYW